MSDTPLDQHAFLSDCGSAALVTAAGSVDWLCLPRFDSAPVLGRLLDPDAGHFLVAPATTAFSQRWRYRAPGLVLETTWDGADGELVVVDALALGRHDRGHELGRSSPGVLLRSVRCTRGSVPVRVEYAPRPEFGLLHPRLAASNGQVVSHGGATVLILSTGVDLNLDGATASATVTVSEGGTLAFALQQCDAWAPRSKRWSARKVGRRLRSTEASWRSWSKLHQRYEGPHRELVLHSGVVLQGLTFARSGAVVAAPTTSLPEAVGGGRNWDYRFSWVRDASMTLQGLFVAACPDEAGRFFSFLTRAAGTQLDRGIDLQIMFGIGGERDLTERQLPHLAGWRNSAPVRAGNGAWAQRQLDVYGAMLDAAFTLREQLGDVEESTRLFLVAAVEAAAARWRDDDQGIWEIRGAPRHYLHSKLMCWVALERGIAMADQLRPGSLVSGWVSERDELRARILREGWSESAGAYTQFFGSDDVDASVLIMAIVGFCPADDTRLLATIDAIEGELKDGRGLLYRYRADDGLAGDEGTFLLCTFWLAQALAITGQVDRAKDVLDNAAGYATTLGLFSEQVDSATGKLLGNFPQAFSHLGLVNAAQALADQHEPPDIPTPRSRHHPAPHNEGAL